MVTSKYYKIIKMRTSHFDNLTHKSWILCIAIVTTLMLVGCVTTTETPTIQSKLKEMVDCVTFDSQKVGTKFNVPNTIVDASADVAVMPFQWNTLQYTSNGYGEVVDNMETRPGMNSIFANNVNLGLDVGLIECVQVEYCDKGGNVNLVISNQVGNKDDLISFDGNTIGTVHVSVTQDSNNCGMVTLNGKFENFVFQNQQNISFAIGGQELFVDGICTCK